MIKQMIISAVFLIFLSGQVAAQVPGIQAAKDADESIFPKQTFGLIECREDKIQFMRPTNQCGINIFEPPKLNDVPFTGLRVEWGAGFVQGFQSLKHRNTAEPRIVNDVNQNQLMRMGPGFNLAGANLYLNTQLASGVRLQLNTYLSSRHHNEAWVKDGYVQMDELPFSLGPLNMLWKHLATAKVGHMEINYGDAHFRRTDNGMGMYNPFVGNYLLDSFTTEIGAEVYLHLNSVMLMGGMTGGEIRGNVTNPQSRNPAFLGKAAYDRQINPDLRVRLSASTYINNKSPANTLYAGDRAGSPYFFALENTQATATAQFTSGTINPGFRNKVRAFQLNPFVKYRGLELFGVIERATGLTLPQIDLRTWNQYAVDTVYRFANDKLFAGVRYNHAEGHLAGIPNKVDVNRTQISGGWFPIPYLLMKAEFVTQNYNGFPSNDIRHGGHFHGMIGHAVLAF